MPQLRSVPLLLLIVLALALPACEKGLKIGDLQILKPQSPLVATSLVVTRRVGPLAAAPATQPATTQPGGASDTEKLVINLDTGRASFTDTQGRVFQTQLSGDDLTTLRREIANRSWRIGQRNAPKGATEATQYTLTVYNGDQPYQDQALWTRPTRNPLPPVFATLESVFHRSERLARPLSENIDLLN
jgi:hypothetical protein